MYKISIIVPVFNVEKTLQNAFDSILSQSIGFDNLEVIFIDDKSTDSSAKIIKEFSDNHKNVKSIYLNENSGFAGKPRNAGIENATANYLMFLDPDDIFLEDACEFLYDNIIENSLDIVSGNYNINRDNNIVRNNWDFLKLGDNESSEVKNIEENFDFLLETPSVWSKIFKKEFILKENIEFLVGVPAQDLVFVSEALFKANGIKFVNKPVVEYIPRQTGENKSVTSKKSKSVLAGFIKSYTELYKIAYRYNAEYHWLGPRNLYFWIKQFVLSDLPIKDKIDLLYMANPLFEVFIKSDKLKTPKYLEQFLELIRQKDFLNASILSKKLDIYYDENIIMNNIKKKKIFLLFYGLDLEIGGLAKATFNRANLLNQHGYNVTLLNILESKNFDYIVEHFHNTQYLDKSIDVINIIEYYALKNNLNKDCNGFSENSKNYSTETIELNDKTKKTNFYILSNKLIKSLYSFNNYSCVKIYSGENVKIEKFYTKDNFNFLTTNNQSYGKTYTLTDRQTNLKMVFDNIHEFTTYFLTELLLNCEEKPFLINENSGAVPNFNDVDSSLAYKIASIHTNPYTEKFHYGSPLREDFSILKDVTKLDYIVVLTEKLRNDLIKEFNVKNIAAICNNLNPNENSNRNNWSKENNRVSLFARLSPEKNISDAIKAFKIVCQKRNDAILEIFGRAVTSGELIEEKKLIKLVKELEIEDNVIFKGHTDNINKEMTKSLATLFVSNFEGLGMVVLESMFNSTPVISYDINYGPSDFIIDGETGYLVKQNDIKDLAKKILFLLDNPSKAIKMGKLAHEQILKQTDDETIFLKWENILKEVYIESRKESMKIKSDINPQISERINKLEQEKIRLYKANERTYQQNRLLKKQNSSKNENLKKILKKIKR